MGARRRRLCSVRALLASYVERNGRTDMLTRCHGEAFSPGVIDPATGKSLITGRTITGFTIEGEYDMHLKDALRSWNVPLIDEWAEKLGGKCTYQSYFISLRETFPSTDIDS